MKNQSTLTRRGFLAQSASAVAAATLGPMSFAAGANDRINVVCIGTGGRAGGLMNEFNKGEVSGDGGAGPDKIKETQKLPAPPDQSHMKNWLECIRSRKPPVADIEAGYRHSVACCMAAEAFFTGKRMVYNGKTMELMLG
jgi:hypothetical protein